MKISKDEREEIIEYAKINNEVKVIKYIQEKYSLGLREAKKCFSDIKKLPKVPWEMRKIEKYYKKRGYYIPNVISVLKHYFKTFDVSTIKNMYMHYLIILELAEDRNIVFSDGIINYDNVNDCEYCKSKMAKLADENGNELISIFQKEEEVIVSVFDRNTRRCLWIMEYDHGVSYGKTSRAECLDYEGYDAIFRCFMSIEMVAYYLLKDL